FWPLHSRSGSVSGLGPGVMFTCLPPSGGSLGVHSISLFYTAYAIAAVGVRVVGGNLIDTRGRREVIVPCLFIMSCSAGLLVALAFFPGPRFNFPVVPFLSLTGLLAGGAHGFLYPALAALLMDVTPERRRGGAVGIFSAMFLVGNPAGAVGFGYIAHWLGYRVMWSVLTLFIVAGFVLSFCLRPSASGELVPAS